MSKMIPPYFDPNRTSLGERQLFIRLKSEPDTENWIILHSLNVAESQKKFCCEIDFLILIPKLGIFCIEAKPGGQIRKNGEWYITDFSGKVIKSYSDSFKQAYNAKYDLLDKIQKKFNKSNNKNYFIFYGIIFPNVSFPIDTIEIEDWRICDINTLNKPLISYLKNLAKNDLEQFSKGRNINYTNLIPQNNIEINNIIEYLRPDFEKHVSYTQKWKENDFREIELIEEQYEILKKLESTGQAIITGPPGSGKTILAIESAKRQIGAGKRIFFACFNELLSKKISNELSKFKDMTDSYVGSFYSYLENNLKVGTDYAEFQKVKEKRIHKYYDKIMPKLFLQFYRNAKFKKFDSIILDDFPDILRLNINLEVLDFMLKGGIQNGNWLFFGDTEGQKLFKKKPTEDQLYNKIKNKYKEKNLNILTLSKNLRSSEQIIAETQKIFNKQSEFINSKNQIIGDRVDYFYYNTLEDEAKQLESFLKDIISKGIQPKDITILTDKLNIYESCINLNNLFKKFKIANLLENLDYFLENEAITFYKIFKFKGNENNCIILIDIDDKLEIELLKSGFDRAKYKLALFVNEKLKHKFVN